MPDVSVQLTGVEAQGEAGSVTPMRSYDPIGLLGQTTTSDSGSFLELGLLIVCNPCGSLMKCSWVALEGGKQVAIAVEKCSCDPTKEIPIDALLDGEIVDPK